MLFQHAAAQQTAPFGSRVFPERFSPLGRRGTPPAATSPAESSRFVPDGGNLGPGFLRPRPGKVLAGAERQRDEAGGLPNTTMPRPARFGVAGILRQAGAGDPHACKRTSLPRRPGPIHSGKPGPSARFHPPPQRPIPPPDAAIIQLTFSTFVPKNERRETSIRTSAPAVGGRKDYLDKMLAEPFEPFTFFVRGRGRLPARPVRHRGEATEKSGI